MRPDFLIIDDFLSNPLDVRKQALQLDYDPALKKGNYPGLLSASPLGVEPIEQTVSEVMGIDLVNAPGTSHGHCRLTLAGEKGRSGVHVDPCYYSGILYLSLPEHCRGGTDFFRHRRTGLEAVPATTTKLMASGYSDPNLLIEDVVNKDTKQPSKWERTLRAPMRFNRLILFNPWMFHNSGPGFGRTPETGRLVCLLFFAAK
ncbi:DUF6445 family protein [uncultured Algimonas sp.]|uniref:DUF6445 family protein n=1 Tax=uncultured Algimonas sp. TaxID=1547920 RepID=UPI00260FAF17|nr:DUF6445 family protein [uncultured Algimonas sp.]